MFFVCHININPCHSSFFGRDHLRSNIGITCGPGSFAVQFGDHLRSGIIYGPGIICGLVQFNQNIWPGSKISPKSIPNTWRFTFGGKHQQCFHQRYAGLQPPCPTVYVWIQLRTTSLYLFMNRWSARHSVTLRPLVLAVLMTYQTGSWKHTPIS